MQIIDGCFVYSASDLNDFLECEHLSVLEAQVARARLARPERKARTELIAAKGIEHERRYVEHLRSDNDVVEIAPPADASRAALEFAAAQTLAAMERGARIIYQGTFFDGTFQGRADFLTRVERPSERWAWSYEVADTKLALHEKPYFVVQLCNYSEHLRRVQGTLPAQMHVILGNGEQRSYRVLDFFAYYGHLKRAFLAQRAAEPPTYPLPTGHCGICSWSAQCDRRRNDDDHLSVVAWMRGDQVEKFTASGITTIAQLALAADDDRPTGMNPPTFERLRRQAALQARQRSDGELRYELLAYEPGAGFSQLPVPDEGDVFFDMEGDPLYEPGRGLEYLFGAYMPNGDTYRAFWGLDVVAEKTAFEQFVDFLTERRAAFPNLHVYHYAPYEKDALRRLAQRHATREDEVDDLLRAEVLVDLFAVVRQSLMISQSSYSLKRLEPFYGMRRETEVRRGDDSIVMFERWLEHPEQRAILDDIEAYNRDDCRSTHLLHGWLLQLRDEAQQTQGCEIAFRPPKEPEAAPEDRAAESALQRELLGEMLTPQNERELADLSSERRTRYLLAHLVAYHRREEKPLWWRFFERCENPDRLLEFDKDAIGGLAWCSDEEPYLAKPGDRNRVYTYAFPEQQYNMRSGRPVDPYTREAVGEIVAFDDEANRVRIKLSRTAAGDPGALRALIPDEYISAKVKKEALARTARAFLDGDLEQRHPATLDLLLRRVPRVDGLLPGMRIQPPTVDAASVSAVVQSLAESYLFVQGPPGTGKSTIGAQVIVDLLAAGHRVGIMANAHKAIHNLLEKVEGTASERGVTFSGFHKHSKSNSGSDYVSRLEQPMILSFDDNAPAENGSHQLVAGNAWLFARERMENAVDYLFIDEAGQVPLADVIAVSAAAKNVVLLGDPSQLAHVSQGTHPVGIGLSVLEHLLGADLTVREDRGIFLDVSYRMQPSICAFISGAMYDGRLHAAPQNERQRVQDAGEGLAGLYTIALDHDGNSRESREEAEIVVEHIRRLLGAALVTRDGIERAVTVDDLIVVTPYNAQRRLIRRLLEDAGIDVRVGTVDKFQGQEAAVVFYSMATSNGENIPRDIGFLFEKNRLNVAISRATTMSVLVLSRDLTNLRCSTVDQMASVNLVCAYLDEARAVASDRSIA